MPLETKPRQVLNEYFVKNAIPTEAQFKELIDASINQADDGVFRTGMSEPLSVVAANDGKRHVLRLYATYPAQQPEWLINLAPANGVSGLSISDGAGNSRLFIDKATGRVGIGTVTPTDALTVQNGDLRIEGGHYRRLKIVSDTYYAGIELVTRELGKDVDPKKAGNPHIDFTHGELDAPNFGIRISAPTNQTLQIQSNVDTKDLVLAVRGTLWTDKAVGVGISAPTGMLDVRVPGAGGWNRFVVNTTNQWGDGDTQHVTIGAGGAAGIMINNPHVPWSTDRASIRYGRSGGEAAGHYWDVGVRASNAFSFAQNASAHRLWINGDGKVGINTTTPNHWLTVQDGDVSIQGGRYRRLKIISDQYWAGIELLAREQGEAGHPHIDFTHGEFDNPNYGIRQVAETNNRMRFQAGSGSAELVADTLTGQLSGLDVADNFAATIRCADFKMGHSSRRGSPGRALVDNTTHLVINYAGDWPQGVRYHGAFAAASSREIKKNIESLDYARARELIGQLLPVQYAFRNDDSASPCLGFVAEDTPFPLADETHQSVRMDFIVAALTKLVQRQQAILEQLAPELLTAH